MKNTNELEIAKEFTNNYVSKIKNMSDKIPFYDKLNIAYEDLLGENSVYQLILDYDLEEEIKNDIRKIYSNCYEKIHDMIINS